MTRRIDTIVLDKTGTLTRGRPSVTAVVATGALSESDLLRFAAAAEVGSEHPLGEAIVGPRPRPGPRPAPGRGLPGRGRQGHPGGRGGAPADTVVIGGGQAGLAMSTVLQRHGTSTSSWSAGASASAGARSAGTRSASSSRTGRSNFPATPTPATIPTASRITTRSSASSRTTRRAPGAGARAHRGRRPRRGRRRQGLRPLRAGRLDPRPAVVRRDRPLPASASSRASLGTSRRRCCRRIPPATAIRRSCRTARSSSSAAARPGARSRTSCCKPVAGCSCRSSATDAPRGASAARTSTGGSRRSVASISRSTRSLIAGGRRRPSSPA